MFSSKNTPSSPPSWSSASAATLTFWRQHPLLWHERALHRRRGGVWHYPERALVHRRKEKGGNGRKVSAAPLYTKHSARPGWESFPPGRALFFAHPSIVRLHNRRILLFDFVAPRLINPSGIFMFTPQYFARIWKIILGTGDGLCYTVHSKKRCSHMRKKGALWQKSPTAPSKGAWKCWNC